MRAEFWLFLAFGSCGALSAWIAARRGADALFWALLGVFFMPLSPLLLPLIPDMRARRSELERFARRYAVGGDRAPLIERDAVWVAGYGAHGLPFGIRLGRCFGTCSVVLPVWQRRYRRIDDALELARDLACGRVRVLYWTRAGALEGWAMQWRRAGRWRTIQRRGRRSVDDSLQHCMWNDAFGPAAAPNGVAVPC